jgi:hypothetical protein
MRIRVEHHPVLISGHHPIIRHVQRGQDGGDVLTHRHARVDRRVQVQVRVVVRVRELLERLERLLNPFRDGRPLFAATIPTKNASSGMPTCRRTCLRSYGL